MPWDLTSAETGDLQMHTLSAASQAQEKSSWYGHVVTCMVEDHGPVELTVLHACGSGT